MRDLARLPKAHLHVHLDGALRAQTLRELCTRQGVASPSVPAKSGYSSFGEFQEVIRASHAILAVRENLTRIVDEVIEDAADDGAVWVELSVWPGLFEGRLGSDTAALTAVLNAGHAAAKRHGIGFGLMVAANRQHGPEAAASTAELAASLAADGVVSFGLDGDETSCPPDAFADSFDVATEAGLLSTPHAGELLGPKSVAAAIDLLHADRVLHGVRAIEDTALVERLAHTRICLDVCPTSNARLGVFDSEHHPLASLLEAGVACSVNADDPLLFGVGLLDEFEHCRTEFLLSDETLAKVAENSVQASGAPVSIKRAALEGIARWLESGETEPWSEKVSVDPAPRIKMHQDEVAVDDDLVRSLLADQFPQWADAALARIADSGTDNAIYRLGQTMAVRLPRIHWAEPQIDKECQWLGRLAGGLSIQIPVPIAMGQPGHGYPFPWLVYPWLEGVSLDRVVVESWPPLAHDIAEFVLSLEKIPTTDGPRPRQRGAPMAPFDPVVQWGLEQVGDLIDVKRAQQTWQDALDAGEWPHDPVWVHGDLLPGNLLVRADRLCGVIDWSGAGIGDPACDAMVAWSLPPDARQLFRETLGFDDATWARAQGWVVQQTILYIPYYRRTLPMAVDQATERLRAAMEDDG